MNSSSAPTLEQVAHTKGERSSVTSSDVTTVSGRVVAATVAGNALEFYDFVTYAFFAVYIGKAFFPSSTPLGSLLLSVAAFGIGFVTRPLGGILIGRFADRAGRKPAMMLTIGLITVGTMGLALTPSYETIGIAAPVIVVFCRLVQGLALGGEVGPSTAFLIESAPSHRRGFFGSWQGASQGVATLVAGAIGLWLTSALSPAELQAWGWRVPFAVGLLLVPVAFYLRNNMPETLHEGPTPGNSRGSGDLRAHWRVIALATVLTMGGTVSNYVGTYMTTYAITTLKLPPVVAMSATVVLGVVTLVFALIGGVLCDHFGRKPLMLLPRIAIALLAVPAFSLLIAHPSSGMLLTLTAVIGLLNAIAGSVVVLAIPEALPAHCRATGLAIAYAVGVAIFGGSTQFVVTWLIGATANPASPAWYVAISSAITAVAILAFPETRARNL
jgi:MFS family permease